MTATVITPSRRNIRQRELVPPGRLSAIHAVVVGAGAIGRQVALQLAAMGVPRLTIYDDDVVAVENLATQCYRPADIGRDKVGVTVEDCASLNPECILEGIPRRLTAMSCRRSLKFKGEAVVFLAPDSIETRGLLFEALRTKAELIIDGRMSAEVIRILAIDNPKKDEYYESTIFKADEAWTGSCTTRSTIYSSAIAAGLMVGQLTRWLRDFPVDRDMLLNLLSAEFEPM